MFSRTTMASSINKPIHSDNAIKVMVLSVRLKTYKQKIVPNNAIGKVKLVITVDRHEPKNKNTTVMAKIAPSNKVDCTSFNDARTERALSATSNMLTPDGKRVRTSSAAARR